MKQQAEIFCQHKRGVASLKIFWFTLAAAARQCWPATLSTEWRTGVDIWEDSWNICISILWKELFGLTKLTSFVDEALAWTDLRTKSQEHIHYFIHFWSCVEEGKLNGGWCAVIRIWSPDLPGPGPCQFTW